MNKPTLALVFALAASTALASNQFAYASGQSTGGPARALLSETGPLPVKPVRQAGLTVTGSHAGGPADNRLSSTVPGPVSHAGTVFDPDRPADARHWQAGSHAGGPYRF